MKTKIQIEYRTMEKLEAARKMMRKPHLSYDKTINLLLDEFLLLEEKGVEK